MDVKWLVAAFAMVSVIFGVSGQSIQCDLHKINKQSRSCSHRFIDDLIKDPSLNCSEAFKNMTHCVYGIVFNTYYKNTVAQLPGIKPQVDRLFSFYFRSSSNLDVMYCGQTMGEQVNISTMPDIIKPHVPCKPEALAKGLACGQDFHAMFTANRTDPALCGLLTKANICEAKVIRENCNKNMPSDIDPYNPFCSMNKNKYKNIKGAANQHLPITMVTLILLFVFKLVLF